MRSPVSLKQEFLKKWMKGLQACSSIKSNMSIIERKNAIKLSADVAMASVRSGVSVWSRALISSASANQNNKTLMERILGPHQNHSHKLRRNPLPSAICSKRLRCKKILKRSCGIRRKVKRSRRFHDGNTVAVAKRLVKKRTEVLRSLVPGGEFMEDQASLIRETLDYIVSLQAQVDVMRRIASATELLNQDAQ